MDARAWIRGERPWTQFLNYCDRLGRTQGTELWAAYLNDERLFDAYRKEIEKADEDKAEHRPSLIGFDRLSEGLHGLQVEIAVLNRALTRNPAYPIPKGPVFPKERFEAEAQEAQVIHLSSAVQAALRRGEERKRA